MATNRSLNSAAKSGPVWEADAGGALALSTLAAAMLAVARAESSDRRWLWVALWLAATVPPWLLAYWLKRRPTTRRVVESFAALVVAAWGLLPLPIAFGLRGAGMGEAVELTMIAMLQNAGLMAAALARNRAWLQASQLAAGFTALFALMAGVSAPLFVLGGCFGLGFVWSLMASYWERVRSPRAALATDRCLPARSGVIVATAATVALIAVLAGSLGGAAVSLRGFLPTSGGQGGSDEFARAGVGDGDALVEAQDDAKGVGPVESELFLESDMPTLYDMANDLYGHPPKPKEKSERSIALDSGKVRLTHEKLAQNKDGGGREFSAIRGAPRPKPKRQRDQESPAMLFVKGEVPAHLALARYDQFDGRVWTGGERATASAPSSRSQRHPVIRLETAAGKPWLRIADSIHAIFRGESRWTVKVINLRTNRLAAPPHPTAVHIDRMDQPDFLGWTDDGSLALTGRSHIPQLTVVHLRARRFHLQPLRDQDLLRPLPANSPESRSLAARFAREWTAGVPDGWRQVEAVVQRLRETYQLDLAARVPEDARDAVEHFLRTGRGPDYLFASACATMLRELGYTTRLATGFYARPERSNPQSGFTAVQADDVHVWVEVAIGGPHWVAIEPTPGYEPPAEALTLWEWLVRKAGRWGRAAAANAWTLAALAALLVAAFAARNWLADAIIAGWLALLTLRADGGHSRLSVLSALRLLEWRARRAGFRRPPHVTLASWYERLGPALAPEARDAMTRLLRSAERWLYAVPEPSINGRPTATPERGSPLRRLWNGAVGGVFSGLLGGLLSGLLGGALGGTARVERGGSVDGANWRRLPGIATLRRAFRDTAAPLAHPGRQR